MPSAGGQHTPGCTHKTCPYPHTPHTHHGVQQQLGGGQVARRQALQRVHLRDLAGQLALVPLVKQQAREGGQVGVLKVQRCRQQQQQRRSEFKDGDRQAH